MRSSVLEGKREVFSGLANKVLCPLKSLWVHVAMNLSLNSFSIYTVGHIRSVRREFSITSMPEKSIIMITII